MFNPWAILRHLADWELRWEDLPSGTWGDTCHRRKRITLKKGLDQAERRSTLTHELFHVFGGPDTTGPWHEDRIDREAARLLVSLRDLADALIWAADDVQLAELLWVDLPTVRCRLANLTEAETAYINRRLDAAERHFPAC